MTVHEEQPISLKVGTVSDQDADRRRLKSICTECGVYDRSGRTTYDNDGKLIQSYTVCARCGRSELKLTIYGRF
jgi:hypothetical protein